MSTHDNVEVDEVSKLAVMPGNATNKMVVSRYVAIAARPAMPRVSEAFLSCERVATPSDPGNVVTK